MGKPVIAPNTTGIRDYFDNQSLPFFEPGDEKSLASEILNLYQNPSLRQDYCIQGNKIYKAHSWELESEKLFNLIRDISPQIYGNKKESVIRGTCVKLYYFLKPGLPRYVQLKIRGLIGKIIRKTKCKDWPINLNSNIPPENWTGWPGKKKFAVVLRHDVESIDGMKNIDTLIELEKDLGFRSSFNFPPERYDVSETLIAEIKKKGFEVGLHGLSHDGKLYSSKKEFQKRAVRINKYLRDWDVCGFVSPSTQHNYEWISQLNILYDSSSFDTDPFEPQPDSINTIFPFIYTSIETGKKYVELPYTLPQDSTLFLILGEKDIRIWKQKIDWIAENKGMVLLNTHPDYMFFDDDQKTNMLYPSNFYKEILEYITTKYQDQFIHFLPCEIAEYWMKR
jgi:peptidoglycan/xylan/chitin deacetylase (PgdA/CDA1 family)